jgi:glycerol-3-phosphate dehydrogenase
MSTASGHEVEVAVIGAGVVGSAVALALARRGSAVALLEAEPEPGLAASGTNSGILHTGFDSSPSELETEFILRSSVLRPPLMAALSVPVLACGAVMAAHGDGQRAAIAAVAENAARLGVAVSLGEERSLSVPGESVTDPVAYTLALAGAAQRHGAELRLRWRVDAIRRGASGFELGSEAGERLRARAIVNCAGLEADSVARLLGDDSFAIYPRKGEFLVFDLPIESRPERILLPVPSTDTKGVLVFPTLDGVVIAGPTAVDQADKRDWSVRTTARDEILPKAIAMHPALADAEQVAEYAGLRPAGRGVNYLIGPSRVCRGLVNVAAIRSTGLTASLGIAERVAQVVASLGCSLGPERELISAETVAVDGPWWRRTAQFRAIV